VAENWVSYSAGKNGTGYGGTRVRHCKIFYQQNKWEKYPYLSIDKVGNFIL